MSNEATTMKNTIFDASSKIQKEKKGNSTLRTSGICYTKTIGLTKESYFMLLKQAF